MSHDDTLDPQDDVDAGADPIADVSLDDPAALDEDEVGEAADLGPDLGEDDDDV